MSRWVRVPDGLYLYCIVEANAAPGFDSPGLMGKAPFMVKHKDVGAVVSPLPYAEIQGDLERILAHQRVVDACRQEGATLPVRFGVIFRDSEGVKKLLASSYDDYRAKLTRFQGMDEFGVKVLVKKDAVSHLRRQAGDESQEVARLRKRLAKSSKGTAFLLQMKLDEAIRNETYRKLDQISREIHGELSASAVDSSLLKAEHEQVVLNAAYLVKANQAGRFADQVSRVRAKYAPSRLVLHLSGPWAPYSFC